MDWKRDGKFVLIVVAVFLMFYFVPVDTGRVGSAVTEALALVQWYIREQIGRAHV